MRRVTPVLFCLVLAGCPIVPLLDAAIGDFELSDVSVDVNEPDWFSDTQLIATTGPNVRLVKLAAATGGASRVYAFSDAEINYLFQPGVSPDRSTAAIGAEYVDTSTRAGRSDILLVDLASGAVTDLTNAAGTYHAPSFLSDSEVMYFDFDGSVDGEVTNRIIRHDLDTDEATVIVENTYPVVDDVTQGSTYFWGKACPVADRLFAFVGDADGTQTFAVLDATTGATILDGHAVLTFAIAMGGDFLDENTIVIAGGDVDDFSYYVIDVATGEITDVYPVDDPRATRVYGVNVSPDGTLVASHAAEFDDDGDFVINRLLVLRIAEAPAD